MKYFLIFLILIGFVGLFLSDNIVYGLWVPLSPEELIEQSKTIFVGTVIDITPVDVEYQSQIAKNGTVKESVGPEVMILEEYTVEVEEFLKNPQDSDTMKVLRATVGGVPSGPAKISGYEIGDRVLFYLPKDEKQTHFPGQYLPESFKIPKQCDAKSILKQPRIDGRNQFNIIQNEIQIKDNFTANIPIQFSYDRDGGTLSGQSFNVSVGINKVTDNSIKNIFQKTIQVNYELCKWISSANWDFVPQLGEYMMVVHISEDGSGSGFSRSFSVIEDTDNFTEDTMKQIEKIEDELFYVIGPYAIRPPSEDTISFEGVEFSYPYYPVPTPPGGVQSVDISFEDGTKEHIGTVGPPNPFLKFTDHQNPQAGVRRNLDGTFDFLLSVEKQFISPLKQFNAGITIDEIDCKDNFVVAIKNSNGHPACVKPETKQKLIERGWGRVENAITITGTDMTINYQISGGKIFSILGHSREASGIGQITQTSLFLMLEATKNGDMILILPRDVIDAKVGDIDDGFFVVLDEIETEYTETKTGTDRTISFSFPVGTKNVEIIGYGYYNEKFSNYPG